MGVTPPKVQPSKSRTTMKAKPKVGDIIYYDGNKLKATSKKKWSASLGTPVAVVVIPASHMPDGKCRGMSLCNMSYKTPQTGTLGTGNDNAEANGTNLMWGVHGTDVSGLTNYGNIMSTKGITMLDFGLFPSDLFKGVITMLDFVKRPGVLFDGMDTQNNEDDTETAWMKTREARAISPYASDGSQNPAYITAGQALADMDGKANTKVIANLSAIKDTYSGGAFENIEENYPAAFACTLFSTRGTSQGDWYLPAMGELGYLYTRIKRINESLAALGTSAVQFGDQTKDLSSLGSWCWSSTKCYSYASYGLTYYGGFFGGGRELNEDDYRVRAFAAFDL